MNLGGNLYDFGKGVTTKLLIEKYARENNITGSSNLLSTTYGYGDRAAEDTVLRLLFGKDKLHVGGIDAKGQTVKRDDGGRDIYLAEYGDDEDSVLGAAVTLQHESYRDGVKTAGNVAETVRAVIGHTKMAERIASTHITN